MILNYWPKAAKRIVIYVEPLIQYVMSDVTRKPACKRGAIDWLYGKRVWANMPQEVKELMDDSEKIDRDRIEQLKDWWKKITLS